MLNNYQDKAVVVTGGTKGIGLATGLAFGRAGAHVYLTHAWASADEAEVKGQFTDIGAPEPVIVEADASRDEDTKKLLEQVKTDHDWVEVFVSNVCVVDIAKGVDSLSSRSLSKSLDYSSWPLVSYVQQMKQAFGRYPRYVVGLSSDGIEHYYQGYEYVAIAKGVMEVFGRYMATHLGAEGVRVNMVRTRNVITESALTVHGADYPEFVEKYGGEKHFVSSEEVGNCILALCSGLLDAMSGQVVNVDRGGAFSDNLMQMYRNREKYGL